MAVENDRSLENTAKETEKFNFDDIVGLITLGTGNKSKSLAITSSFERKIKVHEASTIDKEIIIQKIGTEAVLTFPDLDPASLRMVQLDIGQLEVKWVDRGIGKPSVFAIEIHGENINTNKKIIDIIPENEFVDLFLTPPSENKDNWDFDEIIPLTGEIEFVLVRESDDKKHTLYFLHAPTKVTKEDKSINEHSKAVLSSMLDKLLRTIENSSRSTFDQDNHAALIQKEMGKGIRFQAQKGHKLSEEDKRLLRRLYKLQVHFGTRGIALYGDSNHYEQELIKLIPFLKSHKLARKYGLAPKKYIGPEKWHKVLRKQHTLNEKVISHTKPETKKVVRLDELPSEQFRTLNLVEGIIYTDHIINETLTMFSGDLLQNANRDSTEKLFRKLEVLNSLSSIAKNLKSVRRISHSTTNIRRVEARTNRILTIDEEVSTTFLPTQKRGTYTDKINHTYNTWANVVLSYRNGVYDNETSWEYKTLLNKTRYRYESNYKEATKMLDDIKSMYKKQFSTNAPDYVLYDMNIVAISQIILQLRILRYFDDWYSSIESGTIKHYQFEVARIKDWFYWLNKITNDIVVQEKAIRKRFGE